ncbi:MAG: beta strand repeat-containing protein, partial [Limisphaerales bacterium]
SVHFDPAKEHQKAALSLINGTLFVAFGSHCDANPFHGWLISYDPATFIQKAVFLTTQTTSISAGGGIWMSGGGIAADSNSNIYFGTGNGIYDGTTSFGDSVMKLGQPINGSLPILDWFTPYDQSFLSAQNLDQGGGGVMLLPDQPAGSPRLHLLVTGGKDGTLYLLDRDNMGHYNVNNNNAVWQSIPNAIPGLWSTPAWWNNNIYLAGSGDVGQASDSLRAYHFEPSTSLLSNVSTSHTSTLFPFPGPTPSVSSNGTSNAIVWVLQTDQTGLQGLNSGPAILHAYDATNLATELYNSSQNLSRDDPGLAVKMAVPTVMNGKVYVGTESQLSVFGELPLLAGVRVNPGSVVGGASATGTITLSTGAPSGGITVTLNSNSPIASVPGSVAIGAGVTSVTFPITTLAVTSATTVTISATDGSTVQSATLTVNPFPVGGSVAFVKAAGNFGESVPYTVSMAPTAGNFLAVFVWQIEGAATPTAMTDNLGSVYTKDCDLTFNQGFGARRLTVYHLPNVPGGITGIIITPNRPSRAIVAEYSGMPTGGALLDVCGAVNTQSTASTTWSSAATVITATGLVFGLTDTGFSGNAGFGASGAWTGRIAQHDSIDADDSFFEDQINVASGSYTATGTSSVSLAKSSVLIAFRTTSAPAALASVTLNPATVVGGSPSTGTVTLNAPAPSGGAIVTLSSSNPSATVPSSVTVAANATTATFTVTTSAVSAVTPVTIAGTYNGTRTVTLTVNPLAAVALSSFSVSPTAVTGGVSATGTVTLTVAAPTGGTTVTLSSNNVAANVPANVTVAANAITATFPITTTPVATSTPVTITATLGAISKMVTLTVNPVPVGGSVAFVQAAGSFGESVPYVVNMAPTAGNFLAVFVWQIEGAATSSAMTDNQGSVYTKDCDLTFNQGFGARRLTIYHLPNVPGGITAINITPNKPSRTIVAEYSGMPTGGALLDVCGAVNNQTTASTAWSSAATATTATDLVFGLTDTGFSGNAGFGASGAWTGRIAQHDSVDADDSFFEDQINVASGSYTATGTSSVSLAKSSVVVAFKTTAGPAALASATLNPASVTGGSPSTETVTLSGAAPTGGLVVTLSDNNAAASEPTSVTVPAGATSATFAIATTPVASNTTVTISATLNGTTRTTTLTVNRPALSTVSVNPTSVKGGTSSTGTVALTGAAPTGGSVVTLSDNSSAAAEPSSMTVPAGAITATFTITTRTVTSTRNVTISGSFNGTTRTATLSITP